MTASATPNQGFRFSGSLAASGATDAFAVVFSPGKSRGGGIQLSGTFTATLQFEQSLDNGATWITKTVYPAAGGVGVTSAAATGQWKFACGGESYVRVRCSAFTSGPVVVDVVLTAGLDESTIPGVVSAPVSAPVAVVAQPNEAVTTLATTSGQVISSAWSIAGPVALSGGFVSGASFASLRHLRLDILGSQTAAITATILSGAVSTASTVAAGSATSINLADAAKVIGQEVLAGTVLPGATASGGGTVYRATGLDYVVPNGGQVVFTTGAAITLPGTASSSGVTVGAGVA